VGAKKIAFGMRVMKFERRVEGLDSDGTGRERGLLAKQRGTPPEVCGDRQEIAE
jgi:hypothetical protein